MPRRDDRPAGPRRDDRPADGNRYDSRQRPDGPRDRTDYDRPRGPRPPGYRHPPQGFDRRPPGYGPRPPGYGPRPPGYGPRPTQRYGPPPDRPPRPTRPLRESTEGLLGEDEELIAGKRPVEEAFAARRDAVRLLVVPERRAALDQLVIHATTLRIPVVELEGGSLTALAGFDGHQGIALVSRPRPTADVESILALARQRNEPPFVLVLDSLEDPHNFGALLRSAEACGVHGVIYPTRRAAPLSPAAIKSSAGATEHLLLAPVDDLAGTLVDLHGRGLRIAGAEQDAPLSYSEADMRGPLAIVVGSEGKGISGAVRRRLDLAVGIPMRGRVASLNAAVAGSILLFAAAAQRPLPAASAPTTEGASIAEAASRTEAAEPSESGTDGSLLETASAPDDVEELLPGDG